MAAWWHMVEGCTYTISDRNEHGLLWEEWVQDALTDRQWQVLYLQLQGHTTKEAAGALGVSTNCVRLHRSNAIRRLRAVAQESLRFDSN